MELNSISHYIIKTQAHLFTLLKIFPTIFERNKSFDVSSGFVFFGIDKFVIPTSKSDGFGIFYLFDLI